MLTNIIFSLLFSVSDLGSVCPAGQMRTQLSNELAESSITAEISIPQADFHDSLVAMEISSTNEGKLFCWLLWPANS